jgi:hypothetical protein
VVRREVRNVTEEEVALGCASHCVICVGCLNLLHRLLYHVMSFMIEDQVRCVARDMSQCMAEWVILPLI